MGFQSILFGNVKPELKKETPAFFKDLQLDYLIDRITEQVNGYQTKPYFYTLPGAEDIIRYRQQICKDMESEKLCTVLHNFCRRMAESRKIYNLSLESKEEVASATYHLQAATLYREALQILHKELEEIKISISSEGMKDLATYIQEELKRQESEGFADALMEANKFFSELKFTLSMDPDKLTVSEEETEGKKKSFRKKEIEPVTNYFEDLVKLLGMEPEEQYLAMTDIFPEPLKISGLERVIIGILKKSKPKVFTGLKGFKERFPEIYSPLLLEFEEEVQFYLSFQKFKIRTKGMGYPMEMPQISEHGEFSGREVYDIALVWKQEMNDYEVISNNFTMREHPCFFVVTGPNQGGKTTFARSMGQAAYFTLMGLPVNAECFTMPMFGGISTHFEAEESLQSNSGKLKEEINRLIPMMSRIQNRNHFVILNELFTTATTHDAMVMGRKVMESFLERKCYGIYVTHIQELAEETDEIISLVAQLEPGDESKRTYRMLPMKAQGYGYSDALVKKFHLEYEEIIRRLS